jgi:hypothetical protein
LLSGYMEERKIKSCNPFKSTALMQKQTGLLKRLFNN